MVEAAKRQLVPIDRSLTDVPPLGPAPSPALAYGQTGCQRRAGCYTNRQLEAMLATALAWGGKLADNLRAIGHMSDEATKPK